MIFLKRETTGTWSHNGAPCLVATDAESEDALKKLPVGQVVAVESKRARSVQHHRKFFALLNLVFQNQEQFKSAADLLEATKIDIGHSELRELMDGTRYRVGKSIAFHNLSQKQFEPIYDAALDLWCKHFGFDRSTLEDEAQRMERAA